MDWLAVAGFIGLIFGANLVCYIIGGFIPGLKNSSNRIIVPFFYSILFLRLYEWRLLVELTFKLKMKKQSACLKVF